MGGHQEFGKRAGTENIASIIGFGKAAQIAKRDLDKNSKTLKQLRDYYIENIQKNIPNCRLNGSKDFRLSGNANISFIGIEAEELLLYLDTKNICASSGSACNSGVDEPSHVLTAIGLEKEVANAALRTTFGTDNTYQDIDFLITEIVRFIKNNKL